MSIYNILHGMTPAVLWVLPMLGKHPDKYPRFRDCFLKDEEHPEYNDKILVITRVGGPNRQDYRDEIEELRSMPGYVADYDDSFDDTYATFVFEVPGKYESDFQKIISGDMEKVSDNYKNRIYKIFPKLKVALDKLFSATPIKVGD